MKRIIYYLFAIVAVCGIASCSSDDDPKKIVLSKGESSSITFYANNTSGEISFHAAASWSARTSSVVRATEEIDWLTLDSTHGSAGDVTLSFTLGRNTTGESRSAYILIDCEDETEEIAVTQLPEDDPEIVQNDPLSGLMQNMDFLSRAGYRIGEWDGNFYTYDKDRGLVTMINGNLGNCSFDYSDAPNTIIAESTLGKRYVITLLHDMAEHIDVYDLNNTLEKSYDFEYNKRYLTKVVQYKDGKVYETSELTWNGEDIIEVKTTYAEGVTTLLPVYSDIENDQSVMLFDTQLWIDLDELQFMYYCGIFGFPTRHLIASSTATEVEEGETYSFSSTYSYSFDGNNCPVKVIYSETEQGVGTSTDSMEFSWIRL